ncbi:serine protease [Streptomyces sp. NBC_00237]|uniref:serpin family protein n=1 Tax=Streptomyces sp. NBC_00237 TaxID=2975687 RepID=UPI002258CBAC|nr:serpin family protein [Streptomyces sp. NBC_00237]MCX5201518.1 serine protease [Streptomyces sp. NBC_00237]
MTKSGTDVRTEVGRFAARWLEVVAGGDRGGFGAGDFVRSPAGLWLALGVVAAGARGETARELGELLGVSGSAAAGAVGEVSRVLGGTDALGVATCVRSRVPVYREFREALPGVAVGPLDPVELDGWVREATEGMIEKLPVRIGDDVLLAVVNALALKARWETPFPSWSTADGEFVDAAGVVHEVPTMHREIPLADAWAVGGTRVVELRTRGERGGAPARVRFVLGEEGAGPRDVLPAGWAGQAQRVPLDAEVVRIALPRLELRMTDEVTDSLPAWGVHRATREDADFSGMSPEPLAVSRVVQEAVLKVAEEGVEAAAVSVVLMEPGGAPPALRRTEVVRFERPFGVVVLDGAGELPLFIAWQEGAPKG